MSSKTIIRAVFLTALILLSACGSGHDDGRRLGELIVGTWQRGWGDGDVVFEGETELTPENFTYDKFEFHDDVCYNGMVRKGTFIAYDTRGQIIFEGRYLCDNPNLKLEPSTIEGAILAQVVSITDDTICLKYTFEEVDISVSLIIRKL